MGKKIEILNPEEVLWVAKSLLSFACEAHDRSSISRAYYSVYLTVKYYFYSNGFSDKLLKDHKKIIKLLTGCGDKTIKE